jgi:hypothetical protein
VERLDVAGRQQHPGNNPHRLLGVVGAVVQAEERGRPGNLRNQRSTREGSIHRNTPQNATIDPPEHQIISQDDELERLGPTARDDGGELSSPPPRRRQPPIWRCDEARRQAVVQVIGSQIAPVRPLKMTAKVTTLTSIIFDPIVLATAVPKVNAATKLKMRYDRLPRRQYAGRHRSRSNWPS